LQALVKNINISNLKLAGEVCNAITHANWQCDNPDAASFDCSHLALVYEGRSEHLSINKSEHAIQLRESVNELVISLKEQNPRKCVFYHFTGPEEFDYQVIVDTERNSVLGILKTVSKLEVSDERWAELWSEQ